MTLTITMIMIAVGTKVFGQDVAAGKADTAVRVMTLHECMVYAVENSAKMRMEQSNIDNARIERRNAALSLFTPEIYASTSASYNFGRSIDPQTNSYFKTTSFSNGYGISANIPLFDGFRTVNNYKISKTALEIANSREQQTENNLCLAVMEAYYNVVYYKRLSVVCQQQVSIAEKSLTKAKRQEEVGQKGYADVLEMEADLDSRKYDLETTNNLYYNNLMILTDLMFWPSDNPIEVDTIMPLWAVSDDNTENIVAFAMENNPTIKEAAAQQLTQRRNLSVAKWNILPSINLGAGWGTSYYTYQGYETENFGAQFRHNGGEWVSLSLSFPIWSRLGRLSNISRSKNSLKIATAELEQRRRDTESEVRRAINDRNSSAIAYNHAQHRAELQKEVYNLNIKKLEQGLISPLEYQTAANNYLKAQADEMNSLFQCLIKQAVVEYYSGTNYIDQR